MLRPALRQLPPTNMLKLWLTAFSQYIHFRNLEESWIFKHMIFFQVRLSPVRRKWKQKSDLHSSPCCQGSHGIPEAAQAAHSICRISSYNSKTSACCSLIRVDSLFVSARLPSQLHLYWDRPPSPAQDRSDALLEPGGIHIKNHLYGVHHTAVRTAVTGDTQCNSSPLGRLCWCDQAQEAAGGLHFLQEPAQALPGPSIRQSSSTALGLRYKIFQKAGVCLLLS